MGHGFVRVGGGRSEWAALGALTVWHGVGNDILFDGLIGVGIVGSDRSETLRGGTHDDDSFRDGRE